MPDEVTQSPASAGADNITVKTPKGGHTVLIRPFMTGRDRVTVRGVMLSSMKISGGKDEDEKIEFTAETMQQANLKAMEKLILSVDGDTDEPYEKVLDMHEDDYQAVYDKVSNIAKVSQLADKKK